MGRSLTLTADMGNCSCSLAFLCSGAIPCSVGLTAITPCVTIRINDQWRICFVWDGSDAHEVEIVDYHKG